MSLYLASYLFVCFFSKFIQDKYGYDKLKSAYLAGAVYDVSMGLAPVLGYLVVSTPSPLQELLHFIRMCRKFQKKNELVWK